jgi:K+-transporting ATPase KdpF subunit
LSPQGASPRAIDWSPDMTADSVIGLMVTLALLVYLTFALLKPEKF